MGGGTCHTPQVALLTILIFYAVNSKQFDVLVKMFSFALSYYLTKKLN